MAPLGHRVRTGCGGCVTAHRSNRIDVIYDVASGQHLGLAAGTSAPNLMTGEFFAPEEK